MSQFGCRGQNWGGGGEVVARGTNTRQKYCCSKQEFFIKVRTVEKKLTDLEKNRLSKLLSFVQEVVID